MNLSFMYVVNSLGIVNQNKRVVAILFLSISISINIAFADTIPGCIIKQTFTFAHKDTTELKMDVYRLKESENQQQAVMIFLFGGGFMAGSRDKKSYHDYFDAMCKRGITVISIDYRLALAGLKLSEIKPSTFEKAVNMAVEDLYTATDYIITNADKLNIDASCVMVSGSSAGAIIALQADNMLKNEMPLSYILPHGFSYKGVLSFSGGIVSRKGIKYLHEPSPTMFIHGRKDKIVPYSKYSFFNQGVYGPKALAKYFKKENYDYAFFIIGTKDHDVAETAMSKNINLINWFIDNYVFKKGNLQIDVFLRSIDKTTGKEIPDMWILDH